MAKKKDNNLPPILQPKAPMSSPNPLLNTPAPVIPPAMSTNKAGEPINPNPLQPGNEVVNFDQPNGNVKHTINGVEINLTAQEQAQLNNAISGIGVQPGYSANVANVVERLKNPNIDALRLAAQKVGEVPSATPDQIAAEQANARAILAPDTGNVLSQAAAEGAAGAGVGAAAGLITAGTLSAPAAGVGFVGGFLHGLVSKRTEDMKDNAKQATKVSYIDYQTSKSNIKAIIDSVNNGETDPITAVELYNIELGKIDAAERTLKYESTVAPSSWLNNEDELQRIQTFNSFQRQQTSLLLQQAVLNPQQGKYLTLPSDTLPEDLTQ